MATTPSLIITFLYFSSLLIDLSCSAPSRLTIGIHPSDEKYYQSAVIKCKDGSKSFRRDRLNDNFCDCADGTDEPGTSACPTGTFYCKNMGSTPKFLFSSFVNDHICDCCDGSDEYDGKIMCPNTCIMGGDIVYQRISYDSKKSNLYFVHSRKFKSEGTMGDSAHKLIGLKTLVYLQVAFVIFVVAFRLFRRRKTRRNSR